MALNMKKTMIRLNALWLAAAVVMIVGCSSFSCKPSSDYCASKYPVVLVHGIGFRDRTFLMNYWGSVPAELRKNGARVFTGGQDAYGVVAGNAETLKRQILSILNETGSEKVNIIAHSRGGIESRYMISSLGMEDRVASLTTIATPHRGSVMSDIIMNRISDASALGVVVDFYAKIIGDQNPSSFNAGEELTRGFMKKFNETVPDASQVYYQSYAAEIDEKILNLLWRKMYTTVYKYEGKNDGLVSIESAKWGNFRGVMSCDGKARVSHADAAGMMFLTGTFCFDAPAFYRELIHELKLKGY
jgi:triacylglycerol lipase